MYITPIRSISLYIYIYIWQYPNQYLYIYHYLSLFIYILYLYTRCSQLTKFFSWSRSASHLLPAPHGTCIWTIRDISWEYHGKIVVIWYGSSSKRRSFVGQLACCMLSLRLLSTTCLPQIIGKMALTMNLSQDGGCPNITIWQLAEDENMDRPLRVGDSKFWDSCISLL